METKNQKQKKTRVIPEGQRLLNSWVTELANYLVSEHDMERKQAMEQAHLCRELLQHLGVGRVLFVYRKDDGTEREAWGTMCHGFCPEFDNYVVKGSKRKDDQWPTEQFTYWDLEKQGFRTFKAHRIVKILGVEIPNIIHSKDYVHE